SFRPTGKSLQRSIPFCLVPETAQLVRSAAIFTESTELSMFFLAQSIPIRCRSHKVGFRPDSRASKCPPSRANLYRRSGSFSGPSLRFPPGARGQADTHYLGSQHSTSAKSVCRNRLVVHSHPERITVRWTTPRRQRIARYVSPSQSMVTLEL